MIRGKRKYLNKPQVIDGINFASKKEAKRYEELLMLQKIGIIRDLQVHPVFKIAVNGSHVCSYIGDFMYRQVETGTVVVEDTKGVDRRTGWDTRTETYKLKRKLMKAVHGIEIREV